MKILAFLAALVASIALHAASPDADAMRDLAKDYLAKTPLPIIEKGFSMEDALRRQGIFVDALTGAMGPGAGYKIGLITKSNQERLGANGPIHGALLKRMLLPNGSKVPINYGIRPACELDMGVYVKDSAIMDAKSVNDLAAHLTDLVCFIELVDTITATNQPMDAALLTALNVGARAGIIGERTRLNAELVKALPDLKMTLTTSDGTLIAEVPRLGLQPLENIHLLIADLKKSGAKLKKGDFISLGSPAAPQPIPSGKITLRYSNMPVKDLRATVTFTPAIR